MNRRTVRQTPPCDAVGSPTRHAVPATTATAAGCPPPPQPPTAVTMMTPPLPAGRILSPHVGTGNAVAAVCLGSSAAVGAAATVVARPAVAAGSYLAASVAGYCLRRGCLHKWPSEGGGGQLGAAEVRAPSLPPPPLSPESSHTPHLSLVPLAVCSLSLSASACGSQVFRRHLTYEADWHLPDGSPRLGRLLHLLHVACWLL